jgi:hypothetical protein
MKALLGLFMVFAAFVIGFGVPLGFMFAVNIPADKAYNQEFGSNIDMMTQGASSLIGPGSMQEYLMKIWNQMNSTWQPNNFDKTYGNEENFFLGTLGSQVPHNTLAATNQYFNSLNQTLYQKQKIINEAQAGSYGSDAVQIAVNNTREEINSYGGIDWVIQPLYMRTYQPAAYYSAISVLVSIVLAIVLAIIGFILMMTDGY